MRELCKYLLIFLLFIPTGLAIDECKGTVNRNDVPCQIFLPINTSLTNCNTINVTVYNGSTLLTNNQMVTYNDFLCYSNFTQKNDGTYTFYYGTGDSGSIIVQGNNNAKYYLYLISFLIMIVFIYIGYSYQEPLFSFVGGVISTVLGITIALNGFPNLTNIFFKGSVATILIGIGKFVYFLLRS